MKRSLIVLLFISFFYLAKTQNVSYTFQVNQTCTSCCTASACANWTWTNCPAGPLQYTLLSASSPTAFTFTINPCAYNLCNGTYTFLINGVSSPTCGICGINVIYPSTAFIDHSNFNEPSIHIYPNPAKENIKISYIGSDLLNESEVYIINLLGEKHKMNNTSKDNSLIVGDVSGFSSGIYFIVVMNKDKMLVRKKLIISD